jgi:hypothetical protein
MGTVVALDNPRCGLRGSVGGAGSNTGHLELL